MGYLNNQLEKVASAVTDGMEKKASKLLSVLGKVGRGIKSAPGRALNHVLNHPGKYALGAGLAGLAGWGAYNYANTGEIDPETGLPVLERDRAYVAHARNNDFPGAEERMAYARAAEDYKNKRGYYENMPWWQKILPFAVGDAKRVHQEFYRHSGHLMPRRITTWGDAYVKEQQPYSLRAEEDIENMSEEDRAALDDPKVRDAVHASLDAIRPSTPSGSPWRDPQGFDFFMNSDYYKNAFPRYTSSRPWEIRFHSNKYYRPERYGRKNFTYN